MRRLLVLILAATGGAAIAMRRRAGRVGENGHRGAMDAAWPWSRRMDIATGLFPNGMAYARTGHGPKTVIAIPGGPGNGAPTLRAVGPALHQLVAEGYTCWAVTRRRGMPTGHTVEDMADDYAALISEEFGGRVDLLVGNSMGGMLGFYIAARHPGAVGRLAAVAAAAWTRDEGKAADLAFARALADGRRGDAAVATLGVVAPQIPEAIARVLTPVLMPLIVGDMHPSFMSDLLIEAEACSRYDAREVLASITIPVLVIGGDQDRYFAIDAYEETARLIPGAVLRIHRGQGHMRVLGSSAAAREVIEFARSESPVTTVDA